MRPTPDRGKYLDGVVAVFVLTAVIFLPPLIQLWATPPSPWYLPYLVWLGAIALVALVQRLRYRDEL